MCYELIQDDAAGPGPVSYPGAEDDKGRVTGFKGAYMDKGGTVFKANGALGSLNLEGSQDRIQRIDNDDPRNGDF